MVLYRSQQVLIEGGCMRREKIDRVGYKSLHHKEMHKEGATCICVHMSKTSTSELDLPS